VKITRPGKFGDMVNKKFWKNKKVLITGHTGFKGSWLSQILISLGSEVFGISLKNPVSSPSLYKILNLNKHITDQKLDITNFERCRKAIRYFSPDIIIHMAAQPLVKLSYKMPYDTLKTNIIGTLNVLEVARFQKSVKSILIVTSDKCYQNLEQDYSYVESDSMGGFDPYSASKACAEHISSSYYNSYFKLDNIGVATARAGNVIAGGDWSEDRIFPDMIKAWVKNKSIVIRSPRSKRPWQHVLDVATSYLKLVESMCSNPGSFSGPWNFGPGPENVKTVLTMVKTSQKYWDGISNYVIKKDKNLHETKILKLDTTKAEKMLQIQPIFNYENAIKNTLEWYKNYYSKNDIVNFTKNQIQNNIL